MGQEATGFHRKNEIRRSRLSPIIEGGFCGKTIEAVVQLHCVEALRVKLEHFIWRDFPWIKRTSPVFVVISGCTDANLTVHDRCNFSAFLRDCLAFLATDEPCLPSAVRTDFGKCAIVRFLFAADAAFL